MSKKTKRSIGILLAISLIAAVVALTLPRLMRTDFRTRLAQTLNVDPNFLHLNIPPSPQRYPGFAFVIQGSVLPLASPVDRTELTVGPAFDLQWSDLSKNDASTRMNGGPFSGLFSSDTDDKISLRLGNCRILETDAAKLKQRLLGMDSILKQADTGSLILVITRSYEGQLEMKLQRGSHASANLWAEKVKVAKDTSAAASGDLKVSAADDNQMVLQWSEPVVFAFEAVQAKLFADHLGAKPNNVEFTPVDTSALLKIMQQQPNGSTAPRPQRKLKWALCTISSGYYPKMQTLEQPWNSASAEIAQDAFVHWKPNISDSLVAQREHPLTANDVLAFIQKFTVRAKAEGCELVMAYYVGHTLVSRSGKTALLMGNATRDDVNAFVQSSGNRPAFSALLPLPVVHLTFAEGGVPFMLLVDGCMDYDAVKASLLENAFQYAPSHPGNITYVGPKDVLGPGDFDVIYNSLKQFGQNEKCLTDSNPIIFGSKPGTFASAQPNPLIIGGPSVGPLAERLYSAVENLRGSGQQSAGLDQLISGLGVWRGLGEIGLDGPISWSRFDEFEANARRICPEGARSANDATMAVTRRLQPGIGAIEDFAFDSNGNATWLQIKSVEPTGRNRWDLWLWQSDRPAVKVMDDVLFPKISPLGGGLAVYREPQEGDEIVQLSPSGETTSLYKGTLAGIFPGFDRESLLALDADNIVDQGGDRLIRLTGNSQSVLFTQELTSAKSVNEIAPGSFAWLDDDHEGTIDLRTSSGSVQTISVGDIRLMALTNVSNILYAVDEKREKLFRVSTTGEVKSTWLLDSAERPLAQYEFGFGGMCSVSNELWLADSDKILCLDPDRLEWGKN